MLCFGFIAGLVVITFKNKKNLSVVNTSYKPSHKGTYSIDKNTPRILKKDISLHRMTIKVKIHLIEII
jgi:hypothetical protein